MIIRKIKHFTVIVTDTNRISFPQNCQLFQLKSTVNFLLAQILRETNLKFKIQKSEFSSSKMKSFCFALLILGCVIGFGHARNLAGKFKLL